MNKINTVLSIIVITFPLIYCIRITDSTPTTSIPLRVTTTTYRISVPRAQRPTNRVPSHLQDVRAGYVDDDADDVIHIIEPPSYFQQLKRQRQQAFQIAQPQLTIDTPKKSSMDLLTQETQNNANGVKVTQQKVKFAKILPMQLMKLQEQQQQQQEQPQQYQQPQNAVPFELLASVRHKDRFFQRSRPLALPFARERIRVKKTQTVLMEQDYEQKQHDRGQQLSYGVQRKASGNFGGRSRKRVRRSDDNLTNDYLERKREGTKLNVSFQKSNNSSQKTTERAKKAIQLPTDFLRLRRDVAENNSRNRKRKRSNRNKVGIGTKTTPIKNPNISKNKAKLLQKYAQLKGNDLIDHITELLRNATEYTSEGLRLIRLPSNNKTKTLSQLREKFLIGEIEPTVVSANIKLKEQEINQILEQSVNTTDAIMVALLNYTMLTPEQCPENYGKSIEPNVRMQHLQSRINCIRQQINNKTTPQPPPTLTTRVIKYFGERLTTNAPTVAVNKQQRKPQPNNMPTLLRANLQDQPDNELSTAISINISATLLYDDIMTNIRNMLQAKNLEELNDELDGNKNNDSLQTTEFSLELSPRSIEDATTSKDFGEFNHLNEYLNELQKIVSDFVVKPGNKSESGRSNSTDLSLNSREYTSSIGTTTESLKNWYLINNDGQIYQTKLSDNLHPTVSVFHRFPDIPKAEIYLRNHTLLTDKTKAYEIL